LLPDHVVLDQGVGDDPVAARAQVGVELDARGAVVVDAVRAHDRPVAAVGDVDAVLLDAAVALVPLEQQVVREVREDSPTSG
jgi:hypothetical protein